MISLLVVAFGSVWNKKKSLPRSAGQIVIAACAGDDVAAIVADDDLADRIAGQIDVVGAGGREDAQLLHIDARSQRIADGGAHDIGAAVGGLDHLVARVVDDVAVVAAEARHDLSASAAIDQVGAVIALNRLIEFIAGQIEGVGRAFVLDPQHFHPHARPQHVAGGGVDGVDAATHRFDHLVADGVDMEFVAARSAGHRIVAHAAVEMVVAGTAGERIDDVVADDRVAGRAADDVLDARNRVAADLASYCAANEEIGGYGGGGAGIGDRVDPGKVAVVKVVAGATHDGVIALTAVDLVIARAGVDQVVALVRADRIVVGAGVDDVVADAERNIVSAVAVVGIGEMLDLAEKNVVLVNPDIGAVEHAAGTIDRIALCIHADGAVHLDGQVQPVRTCSPVDLVVAT